MAKKCNIEKTLSIPKCFIKNENQKLVYLINNSPKGPSLTFHEISFLLPKFDIKFQ